MTQKDLLLGATDLLALFSLLIMGSVIWGAVFSPMVDIVFPYGYGLFNPVHMVISIIIFTLFSFARFFLFGVYDITEENYFKLFFYPIYNLLYVFVLMVIFAMWY